jgi:hypothetical protein
MIEHDPFGLAGANGVGHGAELNPGAGVEHHHAIALGHVFSICVFSERADAPRRINKRQVGGRFVRVDDLDLLSQRVEHQGHAQLAAERVAIGTHVADQHERTMPTDQLAKPFPINRHESSS